MALLRRVIGDALRARRQGQHRTLREISTAANVSLGYLSEIERGQKEASSELLAAICEALGSHLSEVLREASDSLARAERAGRVSAEGLPAELPAGRAPAEGAETLSSELVTTDVLRPETADREAPDTPAPRSPVPTAGDAGGPVEEVQTVTDGEVSVSVRRNGPLRTTLRAVHARRPGQPVGHNS